MKIQVEGHVDLVRDEESKAIINTNKSAYLIAKKRADEAQRQRDEIRQTARELNSLKSEMHEIKNMLLKLVEDK
tara:strand:+ start:144 stop:365 length:222 start_codon:yes stop_codon:yes gene_type:complete